MIAQIELAYESARAIGALPREQWEELRRTVDTLGMPEWEEGKDAPQHWWPNDRILIDLAVDGPELTRRDLTFRVRRFPGAQYRASKGTGSGAAAHTTIQVAISNIGLLAVDEVRVDEDCCTDMLGSLLRDGWRILAVCPQPDRRRPDYILGRSQAGRDGAR